MFVFVIGSFLKRGKERWKEQGLWVFRAALENNVEPYDEQIEVDIDTIAFSWQRVSFTTAQGKGEEKHTKHLESHLHQPLFLGFPLYLPSAARSEGKRRLAESITRRLFRLAFWRKRKNGLC